MFGSGGCACAPTGVPIMAVPFRRRPTAWLMVTVHEPGDRLCALLFRLCAVLFGWPGSRYLRGAEVIEIRDGDGNLFNDFRGRIRPEDSNKPRVGTRRTLLLALDSAQYQIDVDTLEGDSDSAGAGSTGGTAALYSSFNVVQRRHAKENNFKAVLESIRDLMTESTTIPEWMHELFLGFGRPEDTQYTVRCLTAARCSPATQLLTQGDQLVWRSLLCCICVRPLVPRWLECPAAAAATPTVGTAAYRVPYSTSSFASLGEAGCST